MSEVQGGDMKGKKSHMPHREKKMYLKTRAAYEEIFMHVKFFHMEYMTTVFFISYSFLPSVISMIFQQK